MFRTPPCLLSQLRLQYGRKRCTMELLRHILRGCTLYSRFIYPRDWTVSERVSQWNVPLRFDTSRTSVKLCISWIQQKFRLLGAYSKHVYNSPTMRLVALKSEIQSFRWYFTALAVTNTIINFQVLILFTISMGSTVCPNKHYCSRQVDKFVAQQTIRASNLRDLNPHTSFQV